MLFLKIIMENRNINDTKIHEAFRASTKKHILMITNHGIHEWKVTPGLPDTGGQNVFVNHLTDELVNLGYKITIINRGGYRHPYAEKELKGLDYKNENQRILYIEDSQQKFVPKEEMLSLIPELVDDLSKYLKQEKSTIDFILSNYWDAAKVGIELNNYLPRKVKHCWIPHSLGTIKKRNSPSWHWEKLRIDERIGVEKKIITQVDKIVSTSSLIEKTLKEDYKYFEDLLFFQPCIDTKRYFPHEVKNESEIWSYLTSNSKLSTNELQKYKIITEISRTDRTKQKDLLIKAFAQVHKKNPDTILVVSIDEKQKELSDELYKLIQILNLEKHVIAVGSIWDLLPDLYAISDIYCTPSRMEGFGMSIQEAAATKIPCIASDLVPFAKEYLLGNQVSIIQNPNFKYPIEKGKGAFVVKASDVNGFAYAINTLLENANLHKEMGENAYNITIPYFTWESMTQELIKHL